MVCLNLNSSALQQARCIFTIYCQPIICSLGLVLNLSCLSLFTLFKFAQQRRINSGRIFWPRNSNTQTYLSALMTFDSLQLFLSLLVIVLPKSLQYFDANELYNIIRTVSIYSIKPLYPVIMMVNYSAIWTITVICVQRYYAVCKPFLNRYRTSILTHARTTLTLIILLAFALNFSRFWEMEWIVHDQRINQSMIIDLDYTDMRRSETYVLINDVIIYSTVIYFGPLSVLSILSFRIVRSIHFARKRAETMQLLTRDSSTTAQSFATKPEGRFTIQPITQSADQN